MSKVYYIKDINADNLIKIFDALNVELKGRVGVKVSTGEKGSRGYLKADLIGPLVKKLNGTILECNTAYDGSRTNYKNILKYVRNMVLLNMLQLILWTKMEK